MNADTGQTEEPKECRICLEQSHPRSLIQPCLCSGTIGFVHMTCLILWVETSKEHNCRVCRSRYQLPWVKVGHSFGRYLKADEMHRLGLILTVLFTALTLLVYVSSLKYCMTNGFNGGDRRSWSPMSVMYALVLMSLVVINLSMVSLVIQFWLCVRNDFKKWQKSHYTMRVAIT